MPESENRRRALSRAEFLKRTAAAGVGLAAMGALSACTSAKADGDGAKWDKEVDVLVVGSGTVAWAGLAASDAGAKSVLIIEKMGTWGGTSALSGGGMGIPLSYVAKEQGINDSREEAIKYMLNAGQGRGTEELAAAYVDNGNAFLEWARDKYGWKWAQAQGTFQDYYEPLDGFLAQGRGPLSAVFDDGAGGPVTWKKLQELLTKAGVEIMLNTAATELVTDANGAVTGVVAKGEDGKEIRVGAAKGVILGTGGFDHNAEMRKCYLATPVLATQAVKGCAGDGQRMGMAIGADLGTMATCWGLPFFFPKAINAPVSIPDELVLDYSTGDWGGWRGAPNSVLVNRYGRRFADESAAYAPMNRAFEMYDTAAKEYRNIPAFFICDSTFTSYYPLPGMKKPGEIPEWMVSANTLEELAEKLGIDKAGLADEIAAFNANAAKGVDPVWHRGEYAIDQTPPLFYANYYKITREGLANPVLAPVSQAPFCGACYGPGTFGTNGGLKINANAQVIHLSGKPITGLYAVGNCAMGLAGGAYAFGGMTVGSGSVMAWVAGRHAMKA